VSDSNGSRRNRLTTTQRGYGVSHQAARRRLAPLVLSGKATCTRCGEPIAPDAPWHLDHRDDRSGYAGPAHAYCNSTAPHRGRQPSLVDDPERGVYWGSGGRAGELDELDG
jgi:hypothetical protein